VLTVDRPVLSPATFFSTIVIRHFRYYAVHAASGAGADTISSLRTFGCIDLDSSGAASSSAESLPKYLAWKCKSWYGIHRFTLWERTERLL